MGEQSFRCSNLHCFCNSFMFLSCASLSCFFGSCLLLFCSCFAFLSFFFCRERGAFECSFCFFWFSSFVLLLFFASVLLFVVYFCCSFCFFFVLVLLFFRLSLPTKGGIRMLLRFFVFPCIFFAILCFLFCSFCFSVCLLSVSLFALSASSALATSINTCNMMFCFLSLQGTQPPWLPTRTAHRYAHSDTE